MIKLIECKNSSPRKIQVKQTDNKIEFVLYNHAIICNHEIEISNLVDCESVTIKYSNTYKKIVQYPNTYNSRDTRTFYENYYQIATDFSIIVAKQGDDIVILVYGVIGENLTDHEVISDSGNWLDILQKHLPAYVEAYRKRKDAKVELMRQVSPLDSISYLEKQVDILSALVLSLIQDKEPEWLPIFQTVLTETSSVSDTTIDKMIEKLYTEKMRIRDLQSVYFNSIEDKTP